MKALVVSVGTGVSTTQKAVKNLAAAIAFSINQHNPDKTFFVASKESEATTLSKLLKQTRTKDYETFVVENPDSIEQVYENLRTKFAQIRSTYDQLAVDYTSGTKAMTGALVILGAIYESDTLSYISGKRKGGIVQTGTEEIHIIKPSFAIIEQKTKTAIRLFNQNQFNAAITLITAMEKTTTDIQTLKRIEPVKNLAKAYDLWDKFQHVKAFQTLRKIDKENLGSNKSFLGRLLNAKRPEPYFIADLLSNAKRRGTEERRYDDAVARLYRTVELIAQHQLKTKYGVQASAAKPADIPHELMKKWNVDSTEQKIRLSLERAYELLHAKNDILGNKHVQDEKLKNLLSKRNTSILAHNLKSVDQKTYKELYEKTLEYAKTIIDNVSQLVADAAFIKLT